MGTSTKNGTHQAGPMREREGSPNRKRLGLAVTFRFPVTSRQWPMLRDMARGRVFPLKKALTALSFALRVRDVPSEGMSAKRRELSLRRRFEEASSEEI